MRKMKSVLGILLILLSVLGLLLWEWRGRDAVMTERVLVAKEDIYKGAELDSTMFAIRGIPKENLLPGALLPEQMDLLEGKVSRQLICENDQIVSRYFSGSEFELSEDQSIFVVKQSWIDMRSSSLRRGDRIEIYGSYDGQRLGTYRIAYVKDESDREVRNADAERKKTDTQSILEREDGTSVIDHIEIIATYSEYEKLVTYAGGSPLPSLVIIQRGDQLDT